MNPFELATLGGFVADAWILAIVAIRGRRRWLQTTYAACSLAFIVLGAASVGTAEGLLSGGDSIVLFTLLLAHALTAILVLGLIHGETMPRRRATAYLLLVPVPVLAFLAPSQGWTAATAYEGTVLGGFMVLCLGVALAETLYARFTSRLLAAHSFWLALAVLALIIGGPIYTYELEFLGAPILAGANVATPLALACFALVALQADPLPTSPKAAKGPSQPGALRAEDAIVFNEVRPKYATQAAHEEAGHGRSVLVIGRTSSPTVVSGAANAIVAPDRHAALKALTTASEFLSTSPGGLVVVDDLAALSVLSGWTPVLEAVVRLRYAAREAHSTVVLSTSRLTASERTAPAERHLVWWDLPDPTTAIEAILSQSFGSGAPRLLESFARAHGLRRSDITAEHVPALIAFLQRALADLSGVVAGTASHGLRVQFEAAGSVLRSFASQGPEELARGKWPSRMTGGPDADLLVTAADYWRGKEMEELFAAAETVSEREPLFERARAVFVEQLGDEGESVLRSQLQRLGKRPEDLAKGDLVRIADRASVDLGALAEVVDLPQERERIHRQITSIRQRLELIVEGEK